jgi:hypothetical protein
MRFAGQARRSIEFAILWAADYRNKLFLDQEGYLRMFALRVAWPSFGNTTVVKMTMGTVYDLSSCNTSTLASSSKLKCDHIVTAPVQGSQQHVADRRTCVPSSEALNSLIPARSGEDCPTVSCFTFAISRALWLRGWNLGHTSSS